MSEEKTIDTIDTLEVVKEEYEKKLVEMQSEYETKIKNMHEQHIAEIRTLMTTGTSPEAETIQEETNPYDEALNSLRQKYKLI